VRIIAGAARSRQIVTPDSPSTRPTGDRVREALFSIILQRVPGAKVLDLFTGSGALALEALSRGAANAVLADHAEDAIRAVNRNIRNLGYENAVQVLRMDWRRTLKRLESENRQFDLIFLDPPYAMKDMSDVGAELAARNLLAPGGMIVAEHDHHTPPLLETYFRLTDRRRYGRIGLSLYQEGEGGQANDAIG
jgi:16S rRNA (guanine(966)-N(2))-methyltransferase RsmD